MAANQVDFVETDIFTKTTRLQSLLTFLKLTFSKNGMATNHFWLFLNWHFHKNYSAANHFWLFETDIFKKTAWLQITFDFFETGIFTKNYMAANTFDFFKSTFFKNNSWLQIKVALIAILFLLKIPNMSSQVVSLQRFFWKSQTRFVLFLKSKRWKACFDLLSCIENTCFWPTCFTYRSFSTNKNGYDKVLWQWV